MAVTMRALRRLRSFGGSSRALSTMTREALVLEAPRDLRLRPIELNDALGPKDVRIQMCRVGICGSDVAYYMHGRISDFVVENPMVLGHEGSGVVLDVGDEVTHLRPGDRVCMEPGIPDPMSRAARKGLYNLDPSLTFWATPPHHGCLTDVVVHPAAFTFPVPDAVSLDQAALVEPLAVGVHACTKAQCQPGDVALVLGAGPIGIITALSALASGCAEVLIADMQDPKLRIAEALGPITGVNVGRDDLLEAVKAKTSGWGVDKVFECSGNAEAAQRVFDYVCPGGTVVHVGHPKALTLDIVPAQVKEARVVMCFRYRHVYPACIKLLASGAIDLKPLITDRWTFDESIQAFEHAAQGAPESIKAVIDLQPSIS